MSTLRDYECPICMIIMIQPVTLPCTHELCLKCFNAGYQNTNALCPFCRVRISTWARHSMKSQTLVNETKWQLIQKLFPEKVEQVMSGKEFCSDDEEIVPVQIISEPGALGQEYEDEIKKIETERARLRQIEEEASAALLEQLRKEDEAARVRQLALEEQANLSFALKLQQELDALSQSEEKLSANKFSSSVPFKSNVPSKPDVPFKPDTNDGNLPWKMSVCSNPPVAPVDYSAKSSTSLPSSGSCQTSLSSSSTGLPSESAEIPLSPSSPRPLPDVSLTPKPASHGIKNTQTPLTKWLGRKNLDVNRNQERPSRLADVSQTTGLAGTSTDTTSRSNRAAESIGTLLMPVSSDISIGMEGSSATTSVSANVAANNRTEKTAALSWNRLNRPWEEPSRSSSSLVPTSSAASISQMEVDDGRVSGVGIARNNLIVDTPLSTVDIHSTGMLTANEPLDSISQPSVESMVTSVIDSTTAPVGLPAAIGLPAAVGLPATDGLPATVGLPAENMPEFKNLRTESTSGIKGFNLMPSVLTENVPQIHRHRITLVEDDEDELPELDWNLDENINRQARGKSLAKKPRKLTKKQSLALLQKSDATSSSCDVNLTTTRSPRRRRTVAGACASTSSDPIVVDAEGTSVATLASHAVDATKASSKRRSKAKRYADASNESCITVNDCSLSSLESPMKKGCFEVLDSTESSPLPVGSHIEFRSTESSASMQKSSIELGSTNPSFLTNEECIVDVNSDAPSCSTKSAEDQEHEDFLMAMKLQKMFDAEERQQQMKQFLGTSRTDEGYDLRSNRGKHPNRGKNPRLHEKN